MFAFCLFDLTGNSDFSQPIVNVWTASFGRITRSSVWTLSTALPRWSAIRIWSLFHFPAVWNPLSHQSSILWVWLIYTFSFLLSTSKPCPNPACVSKFMSLPSFIFSFSFLLVWLYQFTAQFLKCTFIWLSWKSNILIIFLSPKKLWNIIAVVIYIPITLQWQIPYFKFNHLLLVFFCYGPVFNALCSAAPCPLPVPSFDLLS